MFTLYLLSYFPYIYIYILSFVFLFSYPISFLNSYSPLYYTSLFFFLCVCVTLVHKKLVLYTKVQTIGHICFVLFFSVFHIFL
ncbi:hypothetical protein STCU_11018 [Strigomonas culicis]|uniref:Uncharacterized protein n=1 Tax=Strigomonas culicis TaxID=28005 RepID=S9TIN2_9TRYP|nr:hypothetical protein STCU_11018 [Strigomonas culicis]|eukprot:EPY16754.1 hypothetical protein STCU_11018 [Strigomonas culicis]